jgi:hypothetical protein
LAQKNTRGPWFRKHAITGFASLAPELTRKSVSAASTTLKRMTPRIATNILGLCQART